MKYDDLFEVVQGALEKREIHGNRIAGDVTRAVLRALEGQSPALAAERDALKAAIVEYVEANTNESDLAAFRKLQSLARTDAAQRTGDDQLCDYCKKVHDIRLACDEWVEAMRKIEQARR